MDEKQMHKGKITYSSNSSNELYNIAISEIM